ncbi:hypothetical protein [Phaeobacter sp. B1627]|nr:hypothetical protein [Phaeobacter sp. B1627]
MTKFQNSMRSVAVRVDAVQSGALRPAAGISYLGCFNAGPVYAITG